MPRAKKGTQAIHAAPNQSYGAGIDQLQAQRAIPLPDARAPLPPVSANSPGVVPGAQPATQAAPNALQAALAMAPSPNFLTQPTARPQEPVTAGLPLGPGPGSDALSGVGPNLSAMLQTIAQATGDPYFASLSQSVQ